MPSSAVPITDMPNKITPVIIQNKQAQNS